MNKSVGTPHLQVLAVFSVPIRAQDPLLRIEPEE